jgi:hypothetical protein
MTKEKGPGKTGALDLQNSNALTSLRGAKRRCNPFFFDAAGLLRGACHRAALCADPLARNDDVENQRE